jgi:predicted amidohydrolase
MTRRLGLAVAQLGPIARAESRYQAVARLIAMMGEAKGRGAQLVVFPEAALTAFFPHWHVADEAELDAYYETEMPGPATYPLFEAAKASGMAFCLGYAELARDPGRKRRFNTSILVSSSGEIIGKYRKIHLPGHADHEPWRPFQNLEKRYFEPGDLGFPVFDMAGDQIGMCICNDRRWPETWRVLGLHGAELVCLGYNTPTHNPSVPQHDHLTAFHHLLSCQAGAYQNGCWVAAAAKAGIEEGVMQVGNSCIIAPTGEIVAMTSTLEDEVITAVADLDLCGDIRNHIFNFREHRQPQHYGAITAE